MSAPCPSPTAVIGLVLTLSADLEARARLVTTLRDTPHVRLGPPQGSWLPLSAETEDPESLHDWLAMLPGVVAVDVAFVEIAAADTATPATTTFAPEPLPTCP